MSNHPKERYGERVLTPRWIAERERLTAMAAVCDPTTQRVLLELGLAPHWRCLEVGAGVGSVAAWLSEQVGGDGGSVLATDIDTRFLDELKAQRLSVLRHDVTKDPLPDATFDLVHARFVLEHLPEREYVIDRLVNSLTPGGLLVIESIASFPITTSTNPAFRDAMYYSCGSCYGGWFLCHSRRWTGGCSPRRW